MVSKRSMRAEFRQSMGLAASRVINSMIRSAGRKPTKTSYGRVHLIEPLESRQYLTAVTLYGDGSGTTVFTANLNTSTGNVDFYQSIQSDQGDDSGTTLVASVAPQSLTSIVVNDPDSTSDSLTIAAPGTSFSVDGSATPYLTLDVEQGAMTLAATQAIENVEVGTGGTLNLTGNVALNALTVDGTATHASGILTANVLNVDNVYTDAGGSTAPGLIINNHGTFTAAYVGSLASTTGTFNDFGTYVAAVSAGSTISPGTTFNIGSGTFNLSGGGALVLPNAVNLANGTNLTIQGTGTLNIPSNFDNMGGSITQTGGTLVTGELDVGEGANASYSLTNGNIVATSIMIASYQRRGGQTESTFTQNSGTINVTNNLNVGDGYSEIGHYILTSGTLNVGSFYVGAFSHGTFVQSGGSITAGGYSFVGEVSSGASFIQTGGTDTFTYILSIGGYGNGSSVYQLFGGTLNVNALNVGDTWSGEFDLSGTGTLNANSESVGCNSSANGGGVFNQTGGANNISSTLVVGSLTDNTATTAGLYALSGGTLAATTELIGWPVYGGTNASQVAGTLTQTGGVNTVTDLALSDGVYNLTAGTINAYQLTDGYLTNGASNTARFNESGGIANFSGWMMVGYQEAATLSLTGGSMSVGTTLYVGYDTAGTLRVSGGSLAVTGNLYVSGDGHVGDDSAGSGTIYLSAGGTLSAANTFVGYGSNGTLNESGGTLSVTSYLVLDGPGGAVGTYNYSSGSQPTAAQTIDVLKPSDSGNPQGGANPIATVGSPYTLYLSSTTNVGANAITAWNIIWGDSSANTSLSGNPPPSTAQHTYVVGGRSFTVNATASGGGQSFASPPQTIVVQDQPAQVTPVSTQANPLTVYAGSLLNFSTTYTDAGTGETYSASIAWNDPDGNVTPSATSTTPGSVSLTHTGGTGTVSGSHVYENPGPVTATLTITDSGGAVEQTSIYINVLYVAPTLKVIPPVDPVYANQQFKLQLHDYGPTPTNAAGTTGVTHWAIQWGDGTSTTLNSTNNNIQPSSSTPTEAEWDVQHTYATVGNYTVTATATDSSGALPAVTATIAATAPAPIVTIGGATKATRYSPYTLNLSAVYPTSDSNPSSISGWSVNWGDGSAIQNYDGNPASETHEYTDAQGPSSITATATDANGTYTAKSLAIDNSFGTAGNGTVVVDAGSSTDSAYATAIDSQGRIVVAGISGTTVMRFLANGTLDTSFGTGGKVSITGMDWAYGVAIGPNDSVYVGGGYGFDVAKLTSTGQLDTTFGTGGKTTNVLSSSYYEAYDLTVQPDGKILLAGNGSYDFAFARFNPNGSLDNTFGKGGTLVSDIGSPADHSYAVTTQVDGKILAAGYYKMASGNFEMAVARYTSFGVLDSTFGTNGIALTPVGSSSAEAFALTVQPNGDIVLAGSDFSTGTSTTARDFALVRYTPAGVLDTTFGTGGIVTTDFGYGDDQAYAMKVLPGGELLVAGHVTGIDGKDFGLTRYTSAGMLDPTFGVNGLITTKVALSTSDAAEAMTFDANGNVVVAGAANGDFGVAHYDVNSSLTVSVIQPIVSPLVVSSNPVAGATITVSATVLPPEKNSNDTLTYSWSLVDPANPTHPMIMTSPAPSVTFTPPDAGSWGVTLTVADLTTTGWATSSTTFTVAVPQPLTITGPNLISVAGTANYAAGGTAASIASWTVTLGTTTEASGSGAVFAFVPASSGNYTITATAPGGVTASTRLTVTALPPTVTVAGSSSGFAGSAMTFTSQIGSSNEPATAFRYLWTLLNADGVPETLTESGTPSAYPNTNQSFTVPGTLSPGSYTVKVSISSIATTTPLDVAGTFSFNVIPAPSAGEFDWAAPAVIPSSDLVANDGTDAIAEQADGKYVVAGQFTYADPAHANYYQAAYIARYNHDLTLDTTFGSDHSGFEIANLSVDPISTTAASAIFAIAINPTNQDIVVTGEVRNPYFSDDPGFPTLVVAEYISAPEVFTNGQIVSSGSFDPDFNSGHPWAEPSTTTISGGDVLKVLNDGSILVGGMAVTEGMPNAQTVSGVHAIEDFLLIKLTQFGQLDQSFNPNGSTPGIAEQPDVTLQPAYTPFNTSHPVTPTSYPYYSPLTTDFPYWQGIQSLTVLTDGQILAGGSTYRRVVQSDGSTVDATNIGFALVKYNAIGTIHTQFGTGGLVFTDSSLFNGGQEGLALLSTAYVDTNGLIHTAGIAGINSNTHIVMADYDSNGDLAGGFGTNGIYVSSVVDIASSQTAFYRNPFLTSPQNAIGPRPENGAMSFEADGKLIASVATGSTNSFITPWQLDRFDANGSLDDSFGDIGTGSETVPVPASVDPTASLGTAPSQRSSALLLTPDGVVALGGLRQNFGGDPFIIRFRDNVDSAPSATDLTSYSPSPNSVGLSWSNSGSGQDGFEILRAGSASDLATSPTIVATVGPNQYDFIDTSVLTDSTYFYKVVPFATDLNGNNQVGDATSLSQVHTLPSASNRLIQEVKEIPLDGTSITTTTALSSGETYLLVISGSFNLSPGFIADAGYWYSTIDSKAYGQLLTGVTQNDTTSTALKYGVAIGDDISGSQSNLSIPQWGKFGSQSAHTFTLAYVGNGYPLTLQYQAATFASVTGSPLQLEIYALSRAGVTPPASPNTPSGAPALTLSVPAADAASIPAVLSTAAPINFSITPADNNPVPWVLSLVSPANGSVTLASGTVAAGSAGVTTTSSVTIDPSTVAIDGVYELQLSTGITSPGVNNTVTMPIALEKPVAAIDSPVPLPLGLRPVISTNTPIDVVAASPDGTMTSWTLKLIDAANNAVTLAAGNSSAGDLPNSPVDVYTLDPALYPNGNYTLELDATAAGNQSVVKVDRLIQIATAAKAGDLTLPVTDDAVSTVVGPIIVKRSYDSSRLDELSDGIPGFGTGWTFNLLDTQLYTTAQNEPSDLAGTMPEFRAGDLVYMATPDGVRHVFEFDPVPETNTGNVSASLSGVLYVPKFIAVDGSGATLTLPQERYLFYLVYDAVDDDYQGIFQSTGTAGFVYTGPDPTFNPAAPLFGNQYQLTTSGGSSYIINATTGEIESATDSSGNAVTYTTSGNTITATDQAGQTLLTITTSGGNVTSIAAAGQVAPIEYSYANGNLVVVTNTASNTTTYSYQAGFNPHLLTGITNAAGRTLLQVGYDRGTGELASLTNASGKTVPISTAAMGSDDVVQTSADPAGIISYDVVDEAFGTVVRQVTTVENASDIVTGYSVTVTRFTHVSDDVGIMSAFQPSGVLVLQSIQTYAAFAVNGQSALNTALSEQPSANGWTSEAVYDTSNDLSDTSRGQLLYTSTRLTLNGVLSTTIASDYTLVDASTGMYKPVIITVEIQTPDGNSPTGYDTEAQSIHYVGYDSNGNQTYSVTSVERDVPGGGVDAQISVGGFTDSLYVIFSGLSDANGLVETLKWNASVGGYVWTDSTAGDPVQLELLDTSLSGRSSGATPEIGDAWTLSFVDPKKNGDGLQGSLSGVGFDGSPQGFSTLLNTLLAAISGNSTQGRLEDPVTLQLYTGSEAGLSMTVPGWIAQGTENVYGSYGQVAQVWNVTAIINANGTVQSVSPTFETTQNYYYGSSGTLGQSYGQLQYSVNAAHLETYNAYNAAGQSVLSYTYKQWTGSTGTLVSGWVGTTSVYNSAGQLTDTYSNTYLDNTGDSGDPTTFHTLPVAIGGVAGLEVSLPLYNSDSVHTQHTDYDSTGKTTEAIDQYGGVTSYTYDANSNTLKTVSPDGTETLSVYDADNRVIWQTNSFDPNNLSTAITTRTVYNSLGQATETDQYAGELITLGTVTLGSATTPSTSVTTTDGTADGPPVLGSGQSMISTTKTFYDAAGNAIETIGPSGLRTGSIYTPNGQVAYTGPLNSAAPDGGHSVPTYEGINSNDYALTDFASYTETDTNQYTAPIGLFYTKTVDQNGHATQTYTDALGRTERTIYADGSFTETLYFQGAVDLDNQLRDAAGDVIAMPSGDGWTLIPSGGYVAVSIAQRKLGDPLVLTYDLYNAEGQLTDVWQPAVVDGDLNSPTYGQSVMPHWHYGYDAEGNQITQTSPTGHNTSGAVVSGGNTTTFAFDQNGNQVRQTLPNGEVESSAYNVYGQLASSTDFDGNTATYTYATSGTQAGDLMSVVYAGASGSGKATRTVTYTYDDLNRQQTVTDASGTTTSVYDREGDLTESETPEGNIFYVFDPATGNHTETYTAYTDVVYGYDSQDRLQTVTVEKLNGSTLYTLLVTTYTYDAAGNKKTETLPDGEVSTYSYDNLNRLTGVTEVQGSTSLFSESYVLNDDGTRQSSIEIQLQPDGSTVTVDSAWAYDALQRLMGEVVTSTANNESYSNAFSYDLDNNRTKSVHAGPGDGASETIVYSYNGDDELINQSSNLTNQTTVNIYDPNGSLTTSTTGTAVTTYTYDARNKMVGFAQGSNSATYVYDDSGDRVAEVANSVTTLYLTDTQDPTGYDQPMEQRASAGVTPSVTYVLGDRVLAQANGSGQVTYLLIDGHGSTQQLTNSIGVVISSMRYTAFGGAINFAMNTVGTEFLFGGDAVYDSVSGLYLHGDGVRATSGFEFLQRDTASGSNSEPISLQKYSYADCQPVDGIDPSGNDELSDEAFELAGESELDEVQGLAEVEDYTSEHVGQVFAADRYDNAMIGLFTGTKVAGSTPNLFTNPPPALLTFVPIFGSLLNAAYNVNKGNYGSAALDLGFAALDAFGGDVIEAMRGPILEAADMASSLLKTMPSPQSVRLFESIAAENGVAIRYGESTIGYNPSQKLLQFNVAKAKVPLVFWLDEIGHVERVAAGTPQSFVKGSAQYYLDHIEIFSSWATDTRLLQFERGVSGQAATAVRKMLEALG